MDPTFCIITKCAWSCVGNLGVRCRLITRCGGWIQSIPETPDDIVLACLRSCHRLFRYIIILRLSQPCARYYQGRQWGLRGRQSGYQVSEEGSGVLMRKAWHPIPTPRLREHGPTWLQHVYGWVDHVGIETLDRIVFAWAPNQNGRTHCSFCRSVSIPGRGI